jgi:glutamate dehydrogenase (NAD(P)+)
LAPGLKNKTFIVQGYGNVGFYAAYHMVESGAVLTGVVEHDGSIYNENGIDPTDLQIYKAKH